MSSEKVFTYFTKYF